MSPTTKTSKQQNHSIHALMSNEEHEENTSTCKQSVETDYADCV